MALPATDDFTNTNGTALATHNSSWTEDFSSWAINTNSVYTDDATNGLCHWNADTFDDDQYAEAVIAAITSSSSQIGVTVRTDPASGGNYYGFSCRNFGAVSRTLFKVVAGSSTTLDSDGGASTNVSDVIRIEAEGTDIRGLINDVETFSATDASLSSGDAGMFTVNLSVTSKRLDDWEGGNIFSAPVLSQANFRFYQDDGGFP